MEGISEKGGKIVSIAQICHLYNFALYMLLLLYIDFKYKHGGYMASTLLANMCQICGPRIH